MSSEWGSLPLLPLRCILEHLNTKDAMAAMSICHHWRSAILLYEGRKDMLKLRVKHYEKNLFLTRLFRKHTKRLHIYINSNGEELQNFMNHILPQFLDTQKLQELVFIGPSYLQQNENASITKLNRMITEKLVFKHAHCLENISLLGCEISSVNEEDKYTHKLVEYNSKSLTSNVVPTPADSVLSRCYTALISSNLKYISLDYEQVNSASLQTLSLLPRLSQLSLIIGLRQGQPLQRLRWPKNLRVAINIVSVPQRRFTEIMDNVLTEGLTLVSLKVMFCKTMYFPLVSHVVHLYKSTLQEFVWADCPYDSFDVYYRTIKYMPNTRQDPFNVSALILLCWQCTHLRRLVIHGYWVWQYELVGVVRMRRSLQALEVSALYSRAERFGADPPGALCRLIAADCPRAPAAAAVQEVNKYTSFKWKPTPFNKLHPGLRTRASSAQRAAYVLSELARR